MTTEEHDMDGTTETAGGAPQLSLVEGRIVGALIEKQLTTPEYYPLSLNALLAACNQKNNRAPVMTLDEEALMRGIYGLQEKRLVESFSGANARTVKYRERLVRELDLSADERAVVCELLLRGRQTVGELRTRCARMHPFGSLAEVQATLTQLAEHPGGALVQELPRQPGRKEARYTHLLGEQAPEVEAAAPVVVVDAAVAEAAARVEALEARVEVLEARLAALEVQLGIA